MSEEPDGVPNGKDGQDGAADPAAVKPTEPKPTKPKPPESKPVPTSPVAIRVVNEMTKARLEGAVVRFELIRTDAEEAKRTTKDEAEAQGKLLKAAKKKVKAASKAEKDSDAAEAIENLKAAQAAEERARKAKEAADTAAKAAATALAGLAKVEPRQLSAITDDNGDLPNDLRLPDGRWTVTAMATDHLSSKPEEATVPFESKTFELVDLVNDINQKIGKQFFGGLLACLSLLILVYVVVHKKYPEGTSVSSLLSSQSTAARQALEQAEDTLRLSSTTAAKAMEATITESTKRNQQLAAPLDEADSAIRGLLALLSGEPATSSARAGDEEQDTDEKVLAVLRADLDSALRQQHEKELARNQAIEKTATELEDALANVAKLKEALEAVRLEASEATDDDGTVAQELTQKLTDAESALKSAKESLSGKRAALEDSQAKDAPTPEPEDVESRKQALAAKINEIAGNRLTAIDKIIAQIATQEQFENSHRRTPGLWNAGYKRNLEILFWATAGILVNLLMTVGKYLRRNRFYANGIWQHLALLVCVPVLTLVFVFLISMIRIESEAIAIDLSNPKIMAGISFLLAALPWRLWDRLRDMAGQVLGDDEQSAGR